jgi:hypothetical protein
MSTPTRLRSFDSKELIRKDAGTHRHTLVAIKKSCRIHLQRSIKETKSTQKLHIGIKRNDSNIMLLPIAIPILHYTTSTSSTHNDSAHPSSTRSVTSTPTPSSSPYIQNAGGLHAVSNKAANPKKPKTNPKTHIQGRKKKKKTLRRAMDRDAPSHLYAGSGHNVVRRR